MIQKLAPCMFRLSALSFTQNKVCTLDCINKKDFKQIYFNSFVIMFWFEQVHSTVKFPFSLFPYFSFIQFHDPSQFTFYCDENWSKMLSTCWHVGKKNNEKENLKPSVWVPMIPRFYYSLTSFSMSSRCFNETIEADLCDVLCIRSSSKHWLLSNLNLRTLKCEHIETIDMNVIEKKWDQSKSSVTPTNSNPLIPHKSMILQPDCLTCHWW